MPISHCALRLPCSRASSSMRLTRWAASMRASFSSDADQLVACACCAVSPAICSSRLRCSATRRSSSDLLRRRPPSRGRRGPAVAADRAPCRAGRARSRRLSRLSSFWVRRRSSVSSSPRGAARGGLELGARLEELLLGRELAPRGPWLRCRAAPLRAGGSASRSASARSLLADAANPRPAEDQRRLQRRRSRQPRSIEPES